MVPRWDLQLILLIVPLPLKFLFLEKDATSREGGSEQRAKITPLMRVGAGAGTEAMTCLDDKGPLPGSHPHCTEVQAHNRKVMISYHTFGAWTGLSPAF